MKRGHAALRNTYLDNCKSRRFSSMSLQDRIVSLTEWFSNTQSLVKPTPLMDLRSTDENSIQRLYSDSFPIVKFPIEFLKARSFELPARHVEFAILLPEDHLEQAEAFLLGSKDKARKRAQKPWLVTNVLLDTPELWKEAEELNIICTDTSNVDEFPLPRLWQPDFMIETVFLPLLKDSLTANDDVWDLASGAGRDVAFLAEELVSSNALFQRVVGFDHRYNKKETGIVTGFWDRRKVAEKTLSVKMDLSKLDSLEKELVSTNNDSKNVGALFAVRFWKPALIEALASCSSLKPGTLFGMSHFCKPFEGAPWDFEHPTEKTVLERHQLSNIFNKDKHWDILHDEIALDSDHGRSMIHFVAKKR